MTYRTHIPCVSITIVRDGAQPRGEQPGRPTCALSWARRREKNRGKKNEGFFFPIRLGEGESHGGKGVFLFHSREYRIQEGNLTHIMGNSMSCRER